MLTDTQSNLAETLAYRSSRCMPSNISRTTLRYYRRYHIIYSIIHGCEIVFVSNFRLICCVLINIQITFFRLWKDSLETAQE